MQEDLLNCVRETKLLAYEVIKSRVRAVRTCCADDMCDFGDVNSCLRHRLSRRRNSESNALLHEYLADLSNIGCSIHVYQWMVDSADCRACVNASVFVDRQDF